MTKIETIKILTMIANYYPQDFKEINWETRIEAWHLILKDHDYKLIKRAVLIYVGGDEINKLHCVGQLISISNKILVSEMTDEERQYVKIILRAVENIKRKSRN